MAKQRYQRAEDPTDDMSYAEELAQVQDQQQQPGSTLMRAVEQLDAEEESYKKRYQDIQRHIQTVRNQSEQRISAMQQQLDAATRQQIKFPKTDEEVEAWSSKYPDVAKIVDTIARKRANEALAEGEKRLEKVERFEKQVQKQGAEQQLLQRHPDFAEIRQDKKFHDWVATQHVSIQDSVYKNNTDADWASSTIDLYKAQTGGRRSNGAAQAVRRTSASQPPSRSNIKFSESMIEKMSDREFAKHEEEIMEAMHSGKFVYDVSGAAR